MFVSSLLLSLSMSVTLPSSPRALAAAKRAESVMAEALSAAGMKLGDPAFVRIYKQEKQLELWLKPAHAMRYQLFRSYPICAYSGQLGPKTREGDGQAPEGIYAIGPRQLNPWSQFHLSFNLGYPNVYEQAQGWTGSALMVHGNCVSIGCYAMTDLGIEQIYTVVAAALARGQVNVPVHAFPFRMLPEALAAQSNSPWLEFWQTLAPIHAAFETTGVPPQVRAGARGYVLVN